MHDSVNKWAGAYCARIDWMTGGSYFRDADKAKAVRGVVRQFKTDFGHLFDVEKARKTGVKVNVFIDGGTESFDDDKFVETVTVY